MLLGLSDGVGPMEFAEIPLYFDERVFAHSMGFDLGQEAPDFRCSFCLNSPYEGAYYVAFTDHVVRIGFDLLEPSAAKARESLRQELINSVPFLEYRWRIRRDCLFRVFDGGGEGLEAIQEDFMDSCLNADYWAGQLGELGVKPFQSPDDYNAHGKKMPKRASALESVFKGLGLSPSDKEAISKAQEKRARKAAKIISLNERRAK